MKRRKRKTAQSYQSLEDRRVLASLVNLDAATGTLYIRADEMTTTPFVSDFQISNDLLTDEVVVSEVGQADLRFPLTDVQHLSYQGTFGNDRFLNGTGITSRIAGLAGDDFLVGGTNDDVIIAGNGDDTAMGGPGRDYLAGGNGDDTLIENRTDDDGNDRFYGGDGDDTILAGPGADRIVGGDGNDTIEAGTGSDYVLGGDGNDTIDLENGNDIAFGGFGDDIIEGDDGADRIFGQAGNDQLRGDAHADLVRGGDGNDIVLGGDGNDRILGGFGNDILNGGGGADKVFAALPTMQDYTFGIDQVDGGNDSAIDTIISHAVDTVNNRSGDIFVDASVSRARGQRAFLTANVSEPGWSETSSGLQIKHNVVGSGASPTATDRVRVNYTGTFIDGTVFDSNQGIEFFLNQVIAGWTEGLQLMNVGGTAELAIPMELGYGVNGTSSGSIPGHSTLLFTVELLAIV